MTKASNFWTKGEGEAACRLVRAILAAGCTVCVNDGEVTTVRRSFNEGEILDAMATTCEDLLTARRSNDGAVMGCFYLIYGNDEDGSELIADHTANEFCDRLVEAIAPDA